MTVGGRDPSQKGTVLHMYHMAFQADSSFELKYCSIPDCGASLHIFNNLRRFSNFRKAPRGDYVLAGSTRVPRRCLLPGS